MTDRQVEGDLVADPDHLVRNHNVPSKEPRKQPEKFRLLGISGGPRPEIKFLGGPVTPAVQLTSDQTLRGGAKRAGSEVGGLSSWKGVLGKVDLGLARVRWKTVPTPPSSAGHPPSHCPFLDDTADVIKIVPKPLHSSPQHLYLRLRPLGAVRGERGNSESGKGGAQPAPKPPPQALGPLPWIPKEGFLKK